MKITETAFFDVGYPIYGAKFINNTTVVVTGGGGEGNNGVPNKLTAVKINFDKKNKPIKKFRELSLLDNEDCPMTLDISQNVILIGCNQASNDIRNGANRHLRKYEYVDEHLRFQKSSQISESRNSSEYQKCTSISPNASVAAISTSKVPSSVYIVDPNSLEPKYEIKTGGDVKDLHFSPDSKTLCYVTNSALETISPITGTSILRKNDFDWALSKIRFLDNKTILIGASIKNGGGIILAKYCVETKKIVKSNVISKKIKGITSLDFNSATDLIAIAGNDTSVTVLNAKTFKIIQFFNKVHGFAITNVTFSPDGKKLASTSAANTIQVMNIPQGFANHESIFYKAFKNIIIVIFIALLGIAVRFFAQEQYFDEYFSMLAKFIQTKLEKNDSSAYFTISRVVDQESVRTTIKSSHSSAFTEPAPVQTTKSEASIEASIRSIEIILSSVKSQATQESSSEAEVETYTEAEFETEEQSTIIRSTTIYSEVISQEVTSTLLKTETTTETTTETEGSTIIQLETSITNESSNPTTLTETTSIEEKDDILSSDIKELSGPAAKTEHTAPILQVNVEETIKGLDGEEFFDAENGQACANEVSNEETETPFELDEALEDHDIISQNAETPVVEEAVKELVESLDEIIQEHEIEEPIQEILDKNIIEDEFAEEIPVFEELTDIGEEVEFQEAEQEIIPEIEETQIVTNYSYETELIIENPAPTELPVEEIQSSEDSKETELPLTTEDDEINFTNDIIDQHKSVEEDLEVEAIINIPIAEEDKAESIITGTETQTINQVEISEVPEVTNSVTVPHDEL